MAYGNGTETIFFAPHFEKNRNDGTLKEVSSDMLEIKNLTKVYPKGKKAVSNLSMTIADGDLFGFIGKNGAGKTTTIKACLTILDFDTGDILLNGVSIKAAPAECKKKMAYVPDTPMLDSYLTGLQYLNFVCDIYEVPEHIRKKRIDDLANCLGMKDKLNGDSI